MKLSNLFLSFACSALLGVTALACSDPDVGAYGDTGSNASAGTANKSKSSKKDKADDDKGDDDSDDGETPLKTTTGDATATSADVTTPPAATTTADTAPPPAPTATPEACFDHCISPQPQAVAYNTCASACTADDDACFEGCYESSSCSTTPDCGTAISNCDTKCPLE